MKGLSIHSNTIVPWHRSKNLYFHRPMYTLRPPSNQKYIVLSTCTIFSKITLVSLYIRNYRSQISAWTYFSTIFYILLNPGPLCWNHIGFAILNFQIWFYIHGYRSHLALIYWFFENLVHHVATRSAILNFANLIILIISLSVYSISAIFDLFFDTGFPIKRQKCMAVLFKHPTFYVLKFSCIFICIKIHNCLGKSVWD